MITDLAVMMIERLKRYQEVSKSLPERVYVFRDGVSEVRNFDPHASLHYRTALQGQFDTVLEEELPKILDAFKRVSPKGSPQGKAYRPKLTIVICGKRHHARNWPSNTVADKTGNTRPGTVVDQGITGVYVYSA